MVTKYLSLSRLKTTPDQIVEQICKLAKKGATPSQIGVNLRDAHGIAQVKVVTGKRSKPLKVPENTLSNLLQVIRFLGYSNPMVC